MRIEDGGLLGECRNDIRLAMPDARNVVVSVKVGVAGLIVEPYTLSADETDRLFIKQPVPRAE
jgi:hypothetical protein